MTTETLSEMFFLFTLLYKEVSRQKRKGLKERSDWHREQQARDENDSAGDIGKQNQERLL